MEENKIESDFLSQLGYTAFSLNKNNAITVLLKYKAYLMDQAKKGNLTLQECNDKSAWQNLETAKLTEDILPRLIYKMHDGEIVTDAEWQRRKLGKPYFVFILPK